MSDRLAREGTHGPVDAALEGESGPLSFIPGLSLPWYVTLGTNPFPTYLCRVYLDEKLFWAGRGERTRNVARYPQADESIPPCKSPTATTDAYLVLSLLQLTPIHEPILGLSIHVMNLYCEVSNPVSEYTLDYRGDQ